MSKTRLDLHGNSVPEAKEELTKFIEKAIEQNTPKLEIIAGKGNHANANNLRGILYKKIVRWLNELFKSKIKYIIQREGSYSIVLEQGQAQSAAILPVRSTR